MVRIATWLSCLSLLALAMGCGGALPSTVSGTVTLDGNPLTKGDVAFHPVGDGAPAYGKIDASGNYTLSTGSSAGINAGDYIVTVIVTGDPPPAPAASSGPPVAPPPPPILSPVKYSTKDTSDLKKTVVPGKNTIALELKS